MRGSNVSCVVGFDARMPPLCIENLDAHHQTGQAKFLEDALKRRRLNTGRSWRECDQGGDGVT